MKILAMILVPIPLVGYIPFVTIASISAGLIMGFVMAMVYTFDDEYCVLWGGIVACWIDAWKAVKKFYEVQKKEFFQFLTEFREPLKDGEVPFDIRIIDIIVGLFLNCIAIIVDVPIICICSIIWMVPWYVVVIVIVLFC